MRQKVTIDRLDTDTSLRLTADEAIELMCLLPEIRQSTWMTMRVLQAVERSGYDRGHAVGTTEANATEPREERDE